MAWTKDKVVRLKILVIVGKSAASIAAILQSEFDETSRNAVIGKCQRLGLTLAGERKMNSGGNGLRTVPSIARRNKLAAEDRDRLKASRSKKIPELTALVTSERHVEEGKCKWPTGDPKTSEYGLCGRSTSGKRISYCGRHTEMARP